MTDPAARTQQGQPAVGTASVTFGIPVMSKRVSRDWPRVEALLRNTLASVFAQEGADVRALIGCHEVPDVPDYDGRVTFHPVDFDLPRFRWEMELDRMRKQEVLGAEFRTRGGGWLYSLDADDLVARTLAATIAGVRTKAVIVKTGYRLDARQGSAQRLSKVWGKCGSVLAVNWTPEELPVHPLQSEGDPYHYFVECRHWAAADFFDRRGWSYTMLDGDLVTYLVNHGQNESDLLARDTWRWRLYNLATRSRSWTPADYARFGITRAAIDASVYTGAAKLGPQE